MNTTALIEELTAVRAELNRAREDRDAAIKLVEANRDSELLWRLAEEACDAYEAWGWCDPGNSDLKDAMRRLDEVISRMTQ